MCAVHTAIKTDQIVDLPVSYTADRFWWSLSGTTAPDWREESVYFFKTPQTNVCCIKVVCLCEGYHSWWKVCPQWMAATSLE